MPWLHLVRWKNLLIIFITQLLAWWCVILPESPEVLNPVNFLFLSLSTVLIAAAGYIINDYFDIKIDSINRPERVVLEKIIPRKQAIISHALLNITALLFAGYVAARAHHYEWLLLQAACVLLLWFYSTNFKRQFMSGNLIVAVLTALTIIVLFIYEPCLHHSHQIQFPFSFAVFSQPGWVLITYAHFAFMLTWMREIVKDTEDHIGDAAEGCVTMPVKKGVQYSRNFTLMLGALVIFLLVVVSGRLYQYGFTALALYIVLLVFAIICWSIFLVVGAGGITHHYHSASRGLKMIMLLGICSLVIYHCQPFLNHAF